MSSGSIGCALSKGINDDWELVIVNDYGSDKTVSYDVYEIIMP
jgi:hypothetical protein